MAGEEAIDQPRLQEGRAFCLADPVDGSTEAARGAQSRMPQFKLPPPPGLRLSPCHLPDRAKSLLSRM